MKNTTLRARYGHVMRVMGKGGVGPGPWALGHGPWAMGHGPWAMSDGPRALDHGPWAMRPVPTLASKSTEFAIFITSSV